ncbi:MAG: pirin family protein [Thermoplasmatota archaeon]
MNSLRTPLRIRRSHERGHADHGWLDTYHTFSFAGYHDDDWRGHRNLRVINQDTIRPGTGFGAHPHRDMEIVSYVLRGALSHRDSMGNEHTLEPGDVQRMTAGTGVVHAEMSGADEDTEFLQIWIQPAAAGLEPGYDQRRFDLDAGVQVVASADGQQGGIALNADAAIIAGRLDAGQQTTYAPTPGRHLWIHVARGSLELDGTPLGPGDGAALPPAGSHDEPLALLATTDAELLLFELP